MAHLMTTANWRTFLRIYAIQWFLNIFWNPIFFQFHLIVAALFVITCLFMVVIWLGFESRKYESAYWNILLMPYAVWLIIAISLNAYPVFY
jgi:tryptophan-rich sensory protein